LSEPQPKEGRWKISVAGLVIGIILGIIYFVIADAARFALGLLHSFTQSSSNGLAISSDLFDFVNGDLYLILVGALIIVKITHRTIKAPLTVRGPLKMVLGALTGMFYYLILAGGVLDFTVSLKTPAAGSFALSITLLITLALLEISAALKILQGFFEFRDGRKEARAGNQPYSPVYPVSQPPPPSPSPGTGPQMGPVTGAPGRREPWAWERPGCRTTSLS
jgi:hypothetical protein